VTLKETGETFRAQVHRIVIGQEETISLSFLALCLGGHVLIEGVPGTAKTLLARTIAHLVGGTFKRIQFTPDLMPSDIVGTSVYEIATSSFRMRLGPIFANVVLADEVNRAPAKTQSALLEAMEERQVTRGTRGRCPTRSSCSRPRTRWSTRARTHCPKRSSTVSCSRR